MAYEELPPVEEAKALLVKPAAPRPAAVDKVPARRWRGHWLCLFGRGSPEDLTACCLAYNAPCVAFGWNHRRGLGLGFWLEGVKFVALVMLCSVIMHMMDMALMIGCGPRPVPFGEPGFHGPGSDTMEGPWGRPGGEANGGMMMGGGGPGGGGGSFSSFNGNNMNNMMGGPRGGGAFGNQQQAQAMPMTGSTTEAQAGGIGMPKGKPCDKSKHAAGFPRNVDPAFIADVAQRAAINTVSAVAPAGTVERVMLEADASEYDYGYGNQGGVGGEEDVVSYYVDERPSAFGPGGGDPFFDDDDFDGPFGGGPHGPHGPHGPRELLDPICVHAMLISPGMLAMAATLLVATCYMVYYMALRRRQLRERFGIPGSFWHDYCLWGWCSLCALAQETRTMMHNNVHEGIWYGEVPAAAQIQQQQCYAAPAAQQVGNNGQLMV